MPPRARIAEALAEIRGAGSFSTRHTTSADDLQIDVKDVGQLRMPISAEQARELLRVTRPARYGLREQTLLDPAVRDTWEIPRSRVKIDKRRWNRTLRPILTQVATDLGLPEGVRLTAELHSMLVYTPGQFFRPHQDSEKSDTMIASLVVTLPSTFTGGSLAVEHGSEQVEHRWAKDRLTFVAFYADCVHEVRPIRSGHRIVLTYNLLVAGGHPVSPRPAIAADSEMTERLREHFQMPSTARWVRRAGRRPNRLVYLLDHQYTARGLDWSRLKGTDAARATMLRAAADRSNCDTALALADIRETWDCVDDQWDSWGYHHADTRSPQAGELIESVITLESAIDVSGNPAAPLVAAVDDDEVCATTPNAQLEPYESEYEGYMGNYGNTMDRWYRRAAIVVWPRSRAFTVHAEASAQWALARLTEQIADHDLAGARSSARTLEPFWDTTVGGDTQTPGLVVTAVRVATGLDDADSAARLLRPLHLESLTAMHAPDLVTLTTHYGDEWADRLLDIWCMPKSRYDYRGDERRLRWTVDALVALSEGLRTADDSDGMRLADRILSRVGAWYATEITHTLHDPRPSARESRQAALVDPVAAFLAATEIVAADDPRHAVVSALRADDKLLGCAVQILRRTSGDMPLPAALDQLGQHCADRLSTRVALPPRAHDNWSIPTRPLRCCDLCATLSAFLTDPAERELAWPLKKDSRRHIHSRIDTQELPVTHRTVRTGRPFTLLLTKTEALFEAEKQSRQRDEADLAWLQ
ncbi:2OG-Fe(II) oxygenase [Nocardia sp. CA-151230]|uniref:2OG-Fe(II) oxygenase n=1 Tax=Nocardia sp. CA-151230 TaxID=3239982 RepID=UPI003D8DC999